jgi:protein involved in polysaccharide export with SLBB domain
MLMAALALSACATIKRFTPDLSKLPKPQMPFNARGTLGYGHSLRIHVYEGARSPERLFNQVVMVDSKGIIDLGPAGTTQVGGATLPKAADAIAATFRVGLRLSRSVTVHILSVEDTPVVAVRGDVLTDEFIPAWEDMTLEQAVRVSGGRKLGSTAHGVYLIREGERRYFSSLENANELEPEPGDIIELSPDI